MKKNSGVFFKVLLNSKSDMSRGEISAADLQPFPKEAAEAVLAVSVKSKDLAPLLQEKSRCLEQWHYSWVYKLLEPLDITTKERCLLLLSDDQRSRVAELLNISVKNRSLSPLELKFYRYLVFPKLNCGDVLPIEYLPQSSINKLLHLKKSELLSVLDFLGLYDLAQEMKHIVANKVIKELYAALNPMQQNFLRQCMHAKDNVIAPHLHLDQWKGDRKILMRIVHRRGISRLGLALSGQHSDLVWHISRQLDIGRGQLLEKCVQPAKVPALSEAVRLQVENVLNTLFKR